MFVVVIHVVDVLCFFRSIVCRSCNCEPLAPAFGERPRCHVGTEFYPFFIGGFGTGRHRDFRQGLLYETAGEQEEREET